MLPPDPVVELLFLAYQKFDSVLHQSCGLTVNQLEIPDIYKSKDDGIEQSRTTERPS